MLFSNLIGYSCELLSNRGLVPTKYLRKGVNTVSLSGTMLLLLLTTYISNQGIGLTVTILCFAAGLSEMNRSGVTINVLDIAPNFSGPLMCIIMALNTVALILQPLLLGVYTNESAGPQEYRRYYSFLAVISLIGIVAFLFGSTTQETWDKEVNENEEDTFDECEKESLLD